MSASAKFATLASAAGLAVAVGVAATAFQQDATAVETPRPQAQSPSVQGSASTITLPDFSVLVERNADTVVNVTSEGKAMAQGPGARPGARREIMQQYLQRIKDLENLAMTYPGVEKAYAIQAGRELRVIVEADKVSDQDSEKLSFELAQKIQNEMTFPGQIKVTVIREKRAVNVAR